jgi:hypothetical protein
MIPTVRINAEDFIGTDFEPAIWKVIKKTKTENRQEFKLSFYVKKHVDIQTVMDSIASHDDALQLKTTIKTEEKAAKEWVFLDVCSKDQKDYGSSRFKFVADPPANIIGAMQFLTDHFNFVKDIEIKRDTSSLSSAFRSTQKRQKRNDSSSFNKN